MDVFALLVAIGLTAAVTVAIGLVITAGLLVLSRLETPQAKPAASGRDDSGAAVAPSRWGGTGAAALVMAETP